MAEFRAKVTKGDGTELELNARTCSRCKGLGYLTESVTWQSHWFDDDEDRIHIHRAESGDPCPFCVGRGWTVMADGKWRPRLKPQV
jgi:hypothetical protein